MKTFLPEFHQKLAQMRGEAPAELRRSVIALIDREFKYKHLSEHHDLRERNVLYPWLNRITSEEERRALLTKCAGEQLS
jgi:hypothetical protein